VVPESILNAVLERAPTSAGARAGRAVAVALALALWFAPSAATTALAWLAFWAWAFARTLPWRGARKPWLALAAVVVCVVPFAVPNAPPGWIAAGLALGAGALPAHLWLEDFRRSARRDDFAVVLVAQPAIALLHGYLQAHPQALDELSVERLQLLFVATSILHAGLGLVRREPELALGAIVQSQAALVLTGAAAGEAGWSSARMMLASLMLSSFVLLSVLAELRRRFDVLVLSPRHALVAAAPGLHRLFLVCGWLFIGMPGGLAFFAEDLLLHALLEHSLAATLGFVVAAALNAIVFYKVYLGLFSGPSRPASTIPPRAPTERWRFALLTFGVAALVLFGLAPSLFPH
jgi:NADH:ubiquinone oxidoreductase subunit 4 (subunit M)